MIYARLVSDSLHLSRQGDCSNVVTFLSQQQQRQHVLPYDKPLLFLLVSAISGNMNQKEYSNMLKSDQLFTLIVCIP